jgi:Predicted acyl esterases
MVVMVAAVDPHPALKAASEQATPADMFLGDDFHHNGAFRLSYGFEYSYLFEHEKESSSFPFPQYDLYDWYLNLGPLKNVNEKYFHNELPTWNDFAQHPNYDAFWKKRSAMGYVPYPQTAMLHVGGYYDQEDMNGPQLMYRTWKRKIHSVVIILFLAHGIMDNGLAAKLIVLAKFLLKKKQVNIFVSCRKNGLIITSKVLAMENLMKPIVFKQEVMFGKVIAHGRQRSNDQKIVCCSEK